MAGIKYQLALIAKGDTRDADKALGRLEARAGKVSKRVRANAANMAKGFALVGGAAGIGVAVVGFKKLEATQKGIAQTEAVIKSTGRAARVSAKQVTEMADAIASKTGVDDDAIQAGQNMLLTFTQIQNRVGKGNDVFNQATRTMTDMSVALGIDAKQAALQMGKALNDPVNGVTKLQRVGVTFTEQQKKQIKAMADAGDTAGAQKVILAELNKEFGGSAAAFGTTLPGQISKAKQAFEDFSMAIVARALPSITKTIDKGMALIAWMQKAAQKGGVLRPMLDGLRTGMDRIKSALQAAGAAFMSGFTGPAGQSSMTARDLSTSIGEMASKIGTLAEQYLPPLAEKLGQVSRFLVDHRSTIIKVVIAAALLDKGVKAVRLSITAYGAAAKAATKVTQLYRLAKWNLAAAEVKQRIATIATTVATKAQAAASKAAAIAQRLLNAAMRANPIGLIITGLTLLGAGLVLAYKKSDRFRSIVNKVWDWIKKLSAKVLEYKEYLLLLAGPAGALVLAYKKSDKFRDIVQKVAGKLRDIGSTIKDVVLDAVNKLRKAFGKLHDKLKPVAKLLSGMGGALGALGKLGGAAASAVGGVGDGLSVGPNVSGVDSFTPIAQRMGLTMTSAHRPGDPGYHGSNRARDYSNGFGPTSEMLRFAALVGTVYGRQLKELIYTPLGWGIKNGRRVNVKEFYGSKVAAAHNNHVHIALQRGGVVPGLGNGDVVPARLEPGEFVLNRQAVRSIGLSNLAELNSGHPRFGGPKPRTRKKAKPLTLQQRFDRFQTIAGRENTRLDLMSAAQGETPGMLEKLRANAMSQFTKLQTFLQRNRKKLSAEQVANVRSAMAENLRSAQGYAGQIADINQQNADAAAEAAAMAAEAAAQAAADAYDSWRNTWSNRTTMLDLALAQAEETADTSDDAAVLAQLAANARDEYNNLLAKMQDGTLTEATRLELASGAASALRQARQYQQQIDEMANETNQNLGRTLSENERRGLGLLGIKTQPGATEVVVQQYFTQEPNMHAASTGIQWALQGAMAS